MDSPTQKQHIENSNQNMASTIEKSIQLAGKIGDEISVKSNQKEKVSQYFNAQGVAQVLIIKRECEYQNDQKISNQWRDFGTIFFEEQIINKLKEANVEQSSHKAIVQMILNQQERIKQSNSAKLVQFFQNTKYSLNDKYKYVGPVYLQIITKYRDQIQNLKQFLIDKQRVFQKKKKECLQLISLINKEAKNLKIIHIEYLPQINKYQQQQKCRYSISAFDFFKIIHNNSRLTQVTVKGVFVQKLQQFISTINIINNLQNKQLYPLSWLRQFNPSPILNLAIDGYLEFQLQQQEQTCSQIKAFFFFVRMFHELSDITIRLRLGEGNNIVPPLKSLDILWQCLRLIKKIQIQVRGSQYSYFPIESTSFVRKQLLGGLATFAQISHLAFVDMKFAYQTEESDFLAMEQILSTIFNNNAINHLQLHACYNFPVLPSISTLKSINFGLIQFRQQSCLMKKVIHSNRFLRSIKCYRIAEEWAISEELINNLQVLIVQNCSRIQLNISSHCPSKIQYLSIFDSNIGNIDFLQELFPKLTNLTNLKLNGVNFDCGFLGNIPSQSVEGLHIIFNDIITSDALIQVDRKWPRLKHLRLWYCTNITENVWSDCEFKGLTNLEIDYKRLEEKRKMTLQALKRRGVQIQNSFFSFDKQIL